MSRPPPSHERGQASVRSQPAGRDGALGRGRHRHNQSNQPIATLWNRFKEVWRFGVVAKRLAQFGDGPGQRRFAHRSGAPEVVEQPFLDTTSPGRAAR